MQKLIGFTLLALTLFWCSVSYVFAERTAVAWEEVSLNTRQAVLKLKNNGNQSWQKYSVTLKVFENGTRPVAHGFAKMDRRVAPQSIETVSLSLDKALQQGRKYRVLAYIQRGDAKIASQEWSEVLMFDLNRRKERKSPLGEISEVSTLKKPIKGFDIKKAMGIF